METWQQLLLGGLVLLILFWLVPSVKPMLEQSKQAPKDWLGLLIPIGFVVLMVIWLASLL